MVPGSVESLDVDVDDVDIFQQGRVEEGDLRVGADAAVAVGPDDVHLLFVFFRVILFHCSLRLAIRAFSGSDSCTYLAT